MKKLHIGILAVICLLLVAGVVLGTPLTKDRNTPARAGSRVTLSVNNGETIYAGALVMRNAAGYASAGTTTTGGVGIGRASEYVDNSAGAQGAKTVTVDVGVFRYANSSSGDAITSADIGNNCYIVDDNVVSKTSATNSRSVAGKVFDVDTSGVWVDFN